MVITEIQHLPIVHKNLITSLIITTPDTAVNLSVLESDAVFARTRVWTSDPVRLLSKRNSCRWLYLSAFRRAESINRVAHANRAHRPRASSWRNQCSWVISERLWGFTHTLTMRICVEKPLLWHGGLLTQSFFLFFFLANISHCIPSLVLWGLPLQIPQCVYTAAVQYGLVLICSI